MKPTRRVICFGMLFVFLFSTVPIQAQVPTAPSVIITTQWTNDGINENLHAYKLTFSDNGTYEFKFEINHERNGLFFYTSDDSWSHQWGYENDQRTALVEVNTTLEWADVVSLEVTITKQNGQSLPQPITVERQFTVGTWNQPMADHEIMLSTSWDLDQGYQNDEGDQQFILTFDGQGWQQRTGQQLDSWELGNGTFRTVETVDGTETELDLIFTQLWKNETIVGGVLTHQIFDAQGFGTLNLTNDEDGTITEIHANVSEAHLNRSLSNGIVEELLLLEATGTLDVMEQADENSSLDINGELSVFFFEYHDVDGVRVLQHNQFEAMADFVLIDEGTRMDVSLDGFVQLERWEDGVRVAHKEELWGSGTFGFDDEDENSTLVVNGTILEIRSKVENGTTLTDNLHVDGTLSGDVQGTFGILREIEETDEQANASGQVFPVNVIHQDSWFNITGVNGGNFFDGAGIGATHNQTWDYQVVHSDWDNRTVRFAWRETGPNPSEGDERPERSPLERNATAPIAESGLGNLTVGRETGLMPIPLQTGDVLRLNGQEGLPMTLTAGMTRIDTRDGHNLTVIDWTGTYGTNGELGVGQGTLVSAGPLQGLISSVTRTLAIPFGESGEEAFMNETQYLERVLSPEIVSEDENTPPQIGLLELQEGLVLGEGGSVAHLEVSVPDAEWNVVYVEVDLAPLGGTTVSLNDRGLDGDSSIGDDVYTAAFSVPGLEVGLFDVNITAGDSFGAVSQGVGQVMVVNQAPRLTQLEIAPSSLQRGQSIVINVQAYDGHGVTSMQLDLREYGGEVESLSLTGSGESATWTGMFVMPNGMTPGQQSLLIRTNDTLGATGQHRAWTPIEGSIGHPTFGPHYIQSTNVVPIQVNILNDRPTIITQSITVEKDGTELVPFTVQVSDPDGIERVQIDMGVYKPIGETSWILMYDDGRNGGDDIAYDGVYSALLSIRSGTPTGEHEVQIRALDRYGELNSTSALVILELPNANADPNQGLSATVLSVLGAALLLAAGVVVFTLTRNQGNDGEKGDRFGME